MVDLSIHPNWARSSSSRRSMAYTIIIFGKSHEYSGPTGASVPDSSITISKITQRFYDTIICEDQNFTPLHYVFAYNVGYISEHLITVYLLRCLSSRRRPIPIGRNGQG